MIIEGHDWREYGVEFESADGKTYGTKIFARSHGEACALLADLKMTAIITGEIVATYPSNEPIDGI